MEEVKMMREASLSEWARWSLVRLAQRAQMKVVLAYLEQHRRAQHHRSQRETGEVMKVLSLAAVVAVSGPPCDVEEGKKVGETALGCGLSLFQRSAPASANLT
jgi:hypothetical protein